MVLELRIAGPGLDAVHRLKAGEARLVLGRDADSDICLPDPHRNVSRHHLAVWLEAGELHFQVLSVVNGVEIASGEVPPGARGVLPLGQSLRVGEYELTTDALADPAPAREADPWAVFDREGPAVAPATPATHEEDPFGDWGFQTTFGPEGPQGGGLEASSLNAGDVSSFFRGLGLDAGSPGALSEGELEAIGRLVRILVLGVLDLHASAATLKEASRTEDRTMLAPRDSNPLKSDWPNDTKLRYLFGGRLAAVGFGSPERAMRELFVELIAHNNATGAASRSALESTLKEFAPAALKARLIGADAKLFEGTRAWSAYCKYYEEQGADMPQWTQRLLERYFADAYLRESMRMRRETPRRDR
jgi:predicted component of type VI protein secretion system